jgi:probable rRNA maturation factor
LKGEPNTKPVSPARKVAVLVQNASRRLLPRGTAPAIRRLVEGVLGRACDEVTVRIVTDAEMKRLNRAWKGKNRPTDVLAFETGDIVVSIETAARQAKAEKHSLRRELAHLAVHGALHLAGWRDGTARARQAMERETVRRLDGGAIT